MGLDISVLYNLRPTTRNGYEEDDGVHLFKGDWEYQFGNLVEGYFKCDYADLHFHATYLGWSVVREELAKLAGWNKWEGPFKDSWCENFPVQAFATHSPDVTEYTDLPLLPLIHFTDCEGYICTKVCKQLAKDFEKIEVSKHLRALKDMFIWAAENNGIVRFH